MFLVVVTLNIQDFMNIDPETQHKYLQLMDVNIELAKTLRLKAANERKSNEYTAKPTRDKRTGKTYDLMRCVYEPYACSPGKVSSTCVIIVA